MLRFVLVGAAVLVVLTALVLALRNDRLVWAFLQRLLRLGWRTVFTGVVGLVQDDRVPLLARLLPAPLLLYLALPIDLLPDFIPLIGQLDDVIVAAAVAWLLVHLIPAEILNEHFPPPPSGMDEDG